MIGNDISLPLPLINKIGAEPKDFVVKGKTNPRSDMLAHIIIGIFLISLFFVLFLNTYRSYSEYIKISPLRLEELNNAFKGDDLPIIDGSLLKYKNESKSGYIIWMSFEIIFILIGIYMISSSVSETFGPLTYFVGTPTRLILYNDTKNDINIKKWGDFEYKVKVSGNNKKGEIILQLLYDGYSSYHGNKITEMINLYYITNAFEIAEICRSRIKEYNIVLDNKNNLNNNNNNNNNNNSMNFLNKFFKPITEDHYIDLGEGLPWFSAYRAQGNPSLGKFFGLEKDNQIKIKAIIDKIGVYRILEGRRWAVIAKYYDEQQKKEFTFYCPEWEYDPICDYFPGDTLTMFVDKNDYTKYEVPIY